MSALRALKTAAGAACHRACRRRGSTASRAPAPYAALAALGPRRLRVCATHILCCRCFHPPRNTTNTTV